MANMRPIIVYVHGHISALDLDEGVTVRVPKHFGVIRDPIGNHLNRCDVYVCAYEISGKPIGTIPKRMADFIGSYWSPETKLVRITVDMPRGPWHRVGVVRTIHYVRFNKDDPDQDEDSKRAGPFWHDFDGSEGPWHYTFTDRDPTVVLYESGTQHCLKLDLPDGCIINERGLVWP